MNAASTPALRVSNLRAGYGPVAVLHGVSFAVPAGSVVALLGPNGAGKSTLIRALSGLIPSEGKVELNGTELSELPAHKRPRLGLSTVTDTGSLFPDLSVVENIRLGAAVRGGPIRSDAQPAQLMVDAGTRFPAIRERGSTLAGLLSGGEQRMVALAKALASNPSVLMLDEPSQGLSPAIVKELSGYLPKLKGENLAILLVEQNVSLAQAVADSYAVLVDGRIVEVGPVNALNPGHLAHKYLG